ncbi:flavin reductase (NADPH)-like [Ptychodera flava]|uniref:flavin reductase (NADPH)-like n=1 Tax=Ptychodera flava TaxID=63121 RepID=UPI003969C50A
MKLVVLGATGGTGLQVVEQALCQGHHVVAVVRNRSNFSVRHDNLKIVEGDILSPTLNLTRVLQGQDAVMSCLGKRTSFWNFYDSFVRRVSLYTDSMEVIVKAMREAGVKRLICMTSWFVTYDPRWPGPWIVEWIVKPLLLGRIFTNMVAMEDYLAKQCSDINYTIVRPPELNDEPVSGKAITVVEDRPSVGDAVNNMTRADVAEFMLSALKRDAYDKKIVAIGYK